MDRRRAQESRRSRSVPPLWRIIRIHVRPSAPQQGAPELTDAAARPQSATVLETTDGGSVDRHLDFIAWQVRQSVTCAVLALSRLRTHVGVEVAAVGGGSDIA